MKMLLAFCLLGGVSACQPQSASFPATAVAAASTPATAPNAANAPTAGTGAAARAAGPSLALLRRVNLAAGWANQLSEQQPSYPMEGFYGADHYHISFFFDEVQPDPQQPEKFRVRGRTRYKKVITPFAGTITVARLVPLVDTVSMENGLGARAYTAIGTFELNEDPAAKGAGTYQGKALLDFCVNAQGKAVPATFADMYGGAGNPTKGSGLLFEGTWRSHRTGAEKPVAWSSAYEFIVPETLQKMGLGQRGAEPDPRLARYGWFEFMENDEWWHDSPKAPAQL